MANTKKRFERQLFDDEVGESRTCKKAGGKHSHKYHGDIFEDYDIDDDNEYAHDVEHFIKKWK